MSISERRGTVHDEYHLNIGETYFFRQPEHFNLLRETILPEILERKGGSRQLHIWSAGCATGPEPYSVSLLLGMDFEAKLAGWDVSILATDINHDFLERAKKGSFGEWYLRDSPKDLRDRAFTYSNKTWTLRPQFRKRVRFAYHNLADGTEVAGQPFDLILCRNVLIYFSRETSLRLIDQFDRSLSDGGWLLVGYAEPSASLFEAFDTLSYPGVTAYRKKGAGSPSTVPEWVPHAWPLQQDKVVPEVPVKASAPVLPAEVPVAPPATVDDVRLLADTGHWAEAQKIVGGILAHNNLDAPAYFAQGLIHDHNGPKTEARESFQKAIYLDRNFALAFYHLGVALRTDNSRGARRAFRNGLQAMEGKGGDEVVLCGDGMTCQELRDLIGIQLELLPA